MALPAESRLAHFVRVAADRHDADPKELRRIWDEGMIEERCQTIETLRQVGSPLAREWVEEALPKEKHGNRMKLLKSLRTGLAPGDEPFLERCLDDRSPAVGQTAASLLCELPNSAFSQRMRNRAAGLFTMEKKGLVLTESKLICTPPSELEPDWERDGFKKKAAEGEGLRLVGRASGRLCAAFVLDEPARSRAGRSSWPPWPTIPSLIQ